MAAYPHARSLAPALFLLLAAACSSTPPPDSSGGPSPQPTGPTPPPGGPRTALVPPTHPLHARIEAPQAKNTCQSDAECVKGGCSSEVCAAEQVTSTCEMPVEGWPTQGAGCGCLDGQCLWYSTDGRVLPGPAPAGVRCGNATCAAGEHCFDHFGIGGPAAGKVYTCAMRCDPNAQPNGGCPAGKRCGNLADGPGPVCH